MYFEVDMGRTFLMDVYKRKDRTTIYGYEWKKYIAQNNLIGGEYISFSLKGDVNRLRTMYLCSDDDDDEDENQDHDDRHDQQDGGDSQDDEDSDEDKDNQDDEDEEDDADEEDDDDGPLSSAIFSERIGSLLEMRP
nr:FK506-binding protein 4-like [Aegilops tauschii subsp. strangulata]